MEIRDQIVDLADLEARFRPPSERAANKVIDHIDGASARFIDACRFLVLATGVDGQLDASPRGGPAGFVQRLDDRHIAIGDLKGNNRLDSFRNIIANPVAGVILVVPGHDETLRINGAAVLTTDETILTGFTTELRPPQIAVVVRTDELYAHCAKAFRRGAMWRPDEWTSGDDVPDLAAIYACQFGTDADTMRADLDEIYRRDLDAERTPE